MNSTRYYDTHSKEYIKNTVDADLSALYARFLPHVPKGGMILDAGCGSGRDLRYFSSLGYNCRGFDGSKEMVVAAREYSGCEVSQISFETFHEPDAYDAVWACASLLHVQRPNLEQVFTQLYLSLKSNGILYCSFKNREEDFEKEGRSFTCFTPEQFTDFITTRTQFSITDIFITTDVREGRGDESWINAILST